MRHTKILSLLLCLALVLTLLPGMAAYAASPLLKVGVTYYINDTVRLNGSQTAIQDDRGGYRIVNGETTKLKVPAPVYKNGRWEFDFIYPNPNTYQENGLCLGSGKTTGAETVIGFKCVSGNGSTNYPFKFELVFTTSIVLSEDTIDLTVGGTKKLTAAVYPSDTADRTVLWSVGGTNAGAVKLYADEACQTEINYGVATSTTTVYVKGLSEGAAAVTVTTTDGNFTASCTVTVNKADITPVVTIEGWTMGETPKTPNVTGNPGGGAVTYSYKLKDADDSAYTDTIPGAAGVYTVKADIAATENYNAASATADFTIADPVFGTPDFTLPASTRTIGDNAFEGAAMTIVDARSCTAIGAEAFKGCTALKQIKLTQNCTIDDSAFEGCVTVYVFAHSGGTTENWCQGKDNIVFVSLGE